MSQRVRTINLEQAARAILVAFAANIPIALWGRCGEGKSSIFQQIARKLKVKLWDWRMSDKEPSDLGCPYPNHETGKLSYYVPEGLPFDTNEKGILVLEEYDRADSSMQNVSLQLLLDRAANGHNLGENVMVTLTGNAVTDCFTNPLSEAARTRMLHLYIDQSTPDGLNSWLKWAKENGISEITRDFAKYRHETFAPPMKEEQDFDDMGAPNQRTWEMVDRLLQAFDSVKFRTDDIVFPLAAGCVGQTAALDFLAFLENRKKALNPEDIVKDPTGSEIPEGNAFLYATIQSLLGIANEKNSEALVIYGARLPDEFAEILMRGLTERVPSVVTAKAYQDWRASR